MDYIVEVTQQIERIPGARVDHNYLQGHDAVYSQLYNRSEGKIKSLAEVDEFILDSQQALTDIRNFVFPRVLPDDYVFFLEFYGGLLIENVDYNLIVDGIGPMVEDWYGYPLDDDSLYKNGLLSIALLNLKKARTGEHVYFMLDLAGILEQNCVIAITSWGQGKDDPLSIIGNLQAYPQRWAKLANSFIHWLELIAKTSGTLGYL